MKTIRVEGGDLSVSVGQVLNYVHGQDKLLQDLELWLKEPLGQGYTTPNFGSLLEDQIGQLLTPETQTIIVNEIERVLGLYQNWQIEMLKKAKALNTLSYWTPGEILDRVSSITSTVLGDTLRVNISVVTLENRTVGLEVLVGSSGISVQT